MPDSFNVYRVVYAGNDGCTLHSDPVFLDRDEAKAFASRRDGSGLRYGARVDRFRFGPEDLASYDWVLTFLDEHGNDRPGIEPAHVRKARLVFVS